jgi:hypothetical protein
MQELAFKNALARRAEAATELASIDVFLATYCKMVALKPGLEPSISGSINQPQLQVESVAFDSVMAARRRIEDVGTPLRLAKLFNYVTNNGFTITTPNPSSTFSARLRDHGARIGLVFLNKGHGWWLADRPYAPAGYFPAIFSMPPVIDAAAQPVSPNA